MVIVMPPCQALAAGLADAPGNLIQPGGANYDWSVLHANLMTQGLVSHPMAPGDLQGSTAANSRLTNPWVPLDLGINGYFQAVAYILRTPQAGGHWIALLPADMVSPEVGAGSASVLCDSLIPHPFLLSLGETEDLLTTCAIEGCTRMRHDAFGHRINWGCFLVTAGGDSV